LFSGGGVEEYVGAILEAAGDKEKKHFDSFWQYYQEMNGQISSREANIPYDGVEKLLALLKSKGVLLAVLSNKDQASCVQIVEERFGKQAFRVIPGDTGILPVKRDPAGVFAILEELGVAKEECLYVGDTQVDIQTGRSAGVDTVAALWGYRTKEVLEAENPTHFVSNPMEILDWID
jgi:phosphoglycolate phosphatase